MIFHIVEVRRLGGYRLHLRFQDGSEGDVDISQWVPFTGVFERLKDPHEFDKVFLDDDWGCLAWPDDLDLAPDALYAHITGRSPFTSPAP